MGAVDMKTKDLGWVVYMMGGWVNCSPGEYEIPHLYSGDSRFLHCYQRDLSVLWFKVRKLNLKLQGFKRRVV
jgi:hypothetical protein